MYLALLSDIHGNLEALQACLRHARKQGADAFAILGDLVGYGADAVAVIDAVAALAAQGAVVLRGNHDEAVVASESGLNPDAREVARWTRTQLDAGHLDFLRLLPLTARRGATLLVHASAHEPARWHYIEDAAAAEECLLAAPAEVSLVAVGHVHTPRLWHNSVPQARAAAFRPVPGAAIDLLPSRRWLAVLGSVGQPRDGNPAASYALLDEARQRLTFFRVPYDHDAAAAKIRAAGLPEWYAQRLALGK